MSDPSAPASPIPPSEKPAATSPVNSPAPESAAGDPFEALADAHRRTIIDMLRRREQSVQTLADQLPISRPAVSRHLRILKAAGLVADRPDGTRRVYRIDERGIDPVRRYVDNIWGDAIPRFTMFAENTAPTVEPERPSP
ncbi:MAG: ArsR/SmtB family transcription factor [Acidimicrobiales bacterium]